MTARTDVTDRFWSKVQKTGPVMPGMESPCWVWVAAKANGYGVLKVGSLRDGTRRQVYAHRLGFEIQGGRLTPDLPVVCHRCDNPLCVRGDHLFSGNGKINMADCASKLRTAALERNGQAKLTIHHVRVARKLRAWGVMGCKRIASLFGVTPAAIGLAVRGQTWTRAVNP